MIDYFGRRNLVLLGVTVSLIFVFDKLIFLLIFGFLILLFNLYQKQELKNRELHLAAKANLFSPVTGVVQKIDLINGEQHVCLKQSLFKNKSIYCPVSATVKDEFKDGIGLDMSSKLNKDFRLGLLQGAPLQSRLWLQSGDIAELGTHIGFLGINATITVILSDQHKVLVSEKEKVFAGESVLAVLE